MAISSWLVLAGVCLLYVALGLWAVSQIFPKAVGTTTQDDRTELQHQEENIRK
jgi:hypothetical protein